ncbi:MAG TPA: hypothetical protein VEI02_10705 [Planctomycetota bacterium]|nr:hypothetical protein [Planctomycetota bacterium]
MLRTVLSTASRRLAFAAVLAVAAPVVAQVKTPPTVDELLTLHAAGFSGEEMTAMLDRHGEPVFEEMELRRLEQAGVPEPVSARLRSVARKARPRTLTVDELKTLIAAGLDEEGLLTVVRDTVGPFDVTVEQVLELVRSGASPAVIRAVRAKAVEAPASRPAPKPAPPTLDDLVRLVERGFAADAMVQRIVDSDARFDVDAVKLVELTRSGVPKEVIKAVWERRLTAQPPTPKTAPVASSAPATSGDATPAGVDASAESRAASSAPAAPTAVGFTLFNDAPGGYSLLAPEGFREQRDAKNGNALVSFVKGEPTTEDGLAEAELAVFTYRSSAPDRLVEANLGPVGENFLARLTASYAARKISAAFGAREPRRLAGRPAVRVSLTAGGADGTTHSGELWWLFVGERTFILSVAVRSDVAADYLEPLARCVRSFAPAERKARPAGGDSAHARVTTASEAWKSAVLNRDFALYESLLKAPGRDRDRLERFVALCDRFDHPQKRLVIGPVDTFKDGATTEFRLLGGPQPEPAAVRWIRDGESYALMD